MRIAGPIGKFGGVFAFIAILALAGCGEEGAGEKAGKKLDKAGQEMGKSIDDMKKSIGK